MYLCGLEHLMLAGPAYCTDQTAALNLTLEKRLDFLAVSVWHTSAAYVVDP